MQAYVIQEFYGIDQTKNQNLLHQGTASDARNIDTSDGGLSVGKGFVKHIPHPIPGTGPVRRMAIFKDLVTTEYIAIAGDENNCMAVYAYTDTEWTKIYTYPSAVVGLKWDILQCNIGNTDYIIIANGETQMIKWDGETAVAFGTAEKLSNVPVNYMCMHYDRIFAAGDPENPSTLYYSKVPGDGATIEDWSIDPNSSAKSGGSVIIGNSRGDPIMGVVALATQVLILKKFSTYRLQGDNPATWSIERIESESEKMCHSSLTIHGDMAYYLTPAGLYYFNNIIVQPMPNARMLQGFMRTAYVETSKGAECGDKLYLSCYVGDSPTQRDYDNHLIIYDIYRGTYMVRDGFKIADMVSHDGVLYLVNDNRYIYKCNVGTTYDGGQIRAYWQTQRTDLNKKYQDKKIRSVYLRGQGKLVFDVLAGDSVTREPRNINDREEVVEIIPLSDYSRTFAFRFENEAGSYFSLEGGLEALMDTNEGARVR